MCLVKTCHSCRRLTAIFLTDEHYLVRKLLLDQTRRVISATVVDDDDLQVLVALLNGASDAVGDPSFRVVSRNDHGHQARYIADVHRYSP